MITTNFVEHFSNIKMRAIVRTLGENIACKIHITCFNGSVFNASNFFFDNAALFYEFCVEHNIHIEFEEGLTLEDLNLPTQAKD